MTRDGRQAFQRARELYHRLYERDPSEWPALLDAASTDDPELRETVRQLLEDQAQADGILAEVPHWRAAEDAPAPGLPVPKRIGDYRIVRVIGVGGMGIVYEAEQREPRRTVALKTMQSGALAPAAVRRFRNEAQILAGLSHLGIAQIFDVGAIETPGGALPYFAMELVDGLTLCDYATQHRLTTSERLALVVQVCDAVHHAHERGVVHRDIKPANVLVGRDGHTKILDFGVAHATQSDLQATTLLTLTGQLIGTVPYMSPEQVTGDGAAIDARTDVYALGVLTYELLCGEHPLRVADLPIAEAARRITEDDPTHLGEVDAELRGDVDHIVSKALEKEPGRRYATARELGEDIQRHLSHQPIVARPVTTWYQLRKFTRRHRGLVTGLLAVMVVLTIGIITTTIAAVQAMHREAEAVRSAYRASLAAASAALESDNLDAAGRHLESAPAELRGWEWRYVDAQLSPVITEMTLDDRGGTQRVTYLDDGSARVAVVRDDRLLVIEPLSQHVVHDLGPVGDLSNVALAPDGSGVAGTRGGELVVWRPLSADSPLVHALPEASMVDLSLSLGTRRALVWSGDTGYAIDVDSGAVPMRFEFWPPQERFATLVGDGSQLLRGGPDYRLYALDDDTVPRRFLPELPSEGPAVASRDGEWLAFGGDQYSRTTDLFRSSGPAAARTLPGPGYQVQAIAFSPDGEHLASASWGRVRVDTTEDGQTLGLWMVSKESTTGLALSNGARELCVVTESETPTLRILDLSIGRARVLRGHDTYAYSVEWSPDGSMLASADFDGALRLWDPWTGECLGRWAGLARAALNSLPTGHLLTDFGRLDLGSGRLDLEPGQLDNVPRYLPDLAALGHATLMLDSSSVTVVWGPDGRIAARDRGPREIALMRDGFVWAEDAWEGWPVGRVVGTLRLPRDQLVGLRAKAFRPDGRHFATGDREGWLQVYDLKGESLLHDVRAHTDQIFTVTYSPDGARIASGGSDRVIRIWDAATMEVVLELEGHDNYVHELAFSPDGACLASASGDSTVRIWDTVTRAERRREAIEAAGARAKVRPHVSELLQRYGDPRIVAEALRNDPGLGEAERRAAQRVLLSHSHAAPERDRLDREETGLLHRWTFDGDLRDDAGFAHGSLHGDASLQRGELRLDGDGDYASLPLGTTLGSVSSASVEVWVTAGVDCPPDAPILHLEAGLKDWLLVGPGERGLRVKRRRDSWRSDLATDARLEEGRQRHVLVTHEAEGESTRVYVDGELRSSPSADEKGLGTLLTTQGRTSIGHAPGRGFFKGSINELRIYDHALSPEEVAASFAAGPTVSDER